MNNFIKKIPPSTAEQIAELEALSKMTDDDIDYSDIPKMTKEELKKFKNFKLKNYLSLRAFFCDII